MGSDCADCHEDLVGHFQQTAHGRIGAAWSGATAGCAGCHGDTAKHLESGDPADIAVPREPQAAASTCLDCHNQPEVRSHWQGSVHQREGLGCTSCHAIHEPRDDAGDLLAAASESELCQDCHVEQKAGWWKRSAHPLRFGQLTCSDCHNPHGGVGDALVRQASVNDLCYACHAEKRGPFLYEHAPVRENCLSCHQAHGSNHDNLLVTQDSRLCQSCHMQGRHQTVAGAPEDVWMFNRSCLNCHPAVHGSNHPSGIILQR
jgi:DmsE family decaheme c-type cytochrome